MAQGTTSPKPSIEGRPPTRWTELWLTAGEDLKPQRSLERIDGLGRFVFANIAIVGTVLTGLGLFAGVQQSLGSTQVVSVPLVAILVGVTLVLALISVTPWPGRVDIEDPDRVEAWYTHSIRIRGGAAFLAAVAFAATIVLAASLALGRPRSAAPSLTGEFTGRGADARVTMRMEVTGLPAKSRAESVVQGFGPDRTGGLVLCRNLAQADSAGKLTVSCGVDHIATFVRFELTSSIEADGKTIGRDELTLRR